jgi:hypothetical protein
VEFLVGRIVVGVTDEFVDVIIVVGGTLGFLVGCISTNLSSDWIGENLWFLIFSGQRCLSQD